MSRPFIDHIYRKGDIIGNGFIIPQAITAHNLDYIWVICGKCGGGAIRELHYLKAKVSDNCGCLSGERVSKAKTIHGKCHTPIHNTWTGMKVRCTSKSDPGYPRYGGRGIKVYDEWQYNFMAFYDYVTSIEGYNEGNIGRDGLTLDRVDNNGNYEPGNLRWATRHIQNTNQRLRKDNKSGYTGVSYKVKTDKWVCYISLDNNRINIGSFNSPTDAAIARDEFILNNNLMEYSLQILTTPKTNDHEYHN